MGSGSSELVETRSPSQDPDEQELIPTGKTRIPKNVSLIAPGSGDKESPPNQNVETAE
jgi:hypothetical protein